MPPKAAATATAAAAAAAAAAAMAATGTPHGRVPRRTAPTPPGLRDLSEAVLWAQTVREQDEDWGRGRRENEKSTFFTTVMASALHFFSPKNSTNSLSNVTTIKKTPGSVRGGPVGEEGRRDLRR